MTGQSLRLRRPDARNVLLVALLPALGDLLEQWVRAHGLLVARVDHRDRAIELARRLPILSAICEGPLLRAHPEFSDRLHRAQVRAGLIVVLTDSLAGLGEGEALDRGAVDTVVAPGDRDRFGIALARAIEWSQVSDACVRRAITLSIERKVRALARLSRRVSDCGRLLPLALSSPDWALTQPGPISLPPAEPKDFERGVTGAALDVDAGRLPPTSLIVLADTLAERACRDLGLDESRRPFCRDIARARVACLLAHASPAGLDVLAAPAQDARGSGRRQPAAGTPAPGAAA